jgi:hypothetical protein
MSSTTPWLQVLYRSGQWNKSWEIYENTQRLPLSTQNTMDLFVNAELTQTLLDSCVMWFPDTKVFVFHLSLKIRKDLKLRQLFLGLGDMLLHFTCERLLFLSQLYISVLMDWLIDWLIDFMRWVYVSELLRLIDILFIPQMIWIGARRWNDTDRGKPKNSEKSLSQCHFIHHKFHMDWPGREPRPPRWEAGD